MIRMRIYASEDLTSKLQEIINGNDNLRLGLPGILVGECHPYTTLGLLSDIPNKDEDDPEALGKYHPQAELGLSFGVLYRDKDDPEALAEFKPVDNVIRIGFREENSLEATLAKQLVDALYIGLPDECHIIYGPHNLLYTGKML